jgi:UPF0755 protein
VKQFRRIVFAGIACALVVAGLGAALAYALYGERSHPASPTQVIIARGSTFDEIAERLATEGIISNVWTFRMLARLRREDVAVHAGEYRFTPHRTQDEILRALVSGGAQVASWVTIPEGFAAGQIAERLAATGIGPAADFDRYFMHQPLEVYGVRTRNLEGYLFPSTYLVPLGAAPSQVAGMLTAEFFRQIPADAASLARKQHVSVAQAVTVASLVEREAKESADRPRIAEVIYNRLRLGMPLQVDATIEYALPKHKSELSFADLKIDSPYNTYAHAGLPPTPIANPGRPSLEAALNPWKSDDLYYVYCGNGRHVFAKTLAEHQANVARCLQ